MWWIVGVMIFGNFMTTEAVWADPLAAASGEPFSQQAGSPGAVSLSPASPPETHWSSYLGTAASTAVVILGAAYGIAKIGSTAVENMARQPEVAGSINTAMVVSAALIEGVTFFALIICLLSLFYK
ncbi:MAG: ATP synthase F0 subunit C [Thermoguttaceae bacterium]|nr:ATP synthase F0 subunit C [Thermoguttaceae bacterium]MDW8039396.1 ATP synthase F0 subunit C [Thermoguttaceae bacterium]